jgi:uncharacterized damage-inducible protein DinB
MKQHFAMLADYNRWANRRLYDMAEALPENLLKKDVGVYFRSLHGTLNHLLAADRIWMHRLDGQDSHPDRLNAILFDDLPSLRAARQLEDTRIVNFIGRLADSEFDTSREYLTLNGAPQQQPLRYILAHLFNHQTHHRGQAHAALTMLGVIEPQPLDLLIMQREAAGAQ